MLNKYKNWPGDPHCGGIARTTIAIHRLSSRPPSDIWVHAYGRDKRSDAPSWLCSKQRAVTALTTAPAHCNGVIGPARSRREFMWNCTNQRARDFTSDRPLCLKILPGVKHVAFFWNSVLLSVSSFIYTGEHATYADLGVFERGHGVLIHHIFKYILYIIRKCVSSQK